MIAKVQQGTTHIEAIQNTEGDTVTDRTRVPKVFSDFFRDLYMSKVHPTRGAEPLFGPVLPSPVIAALSNPLTLELTLAVAQMANNKSP